MKSSFVFLIVSVLIQPAFAADFKVTKVSSSGDRVIVSSAKGHTLKTGDTLEHINEFSESCRANVVKAETDKLVLNISNCRTASQIKPGSVFAVASAKPAPAKAEPRKQQDKSEQKWSSSGAPSKDEDWYTLWGFGTASPAYSDKALQNEVDQLEDSSAVNRYGYNFDLFGFYWPHADRKSMSGFIINGITDLFTATSTNETLSISNSLYAYSYHKFFGANIGDGWFLRGDAGLNRFVVTATLGAAEVTGESDFGLGVLGGGGYAWGISPETRMLLGGYISSRSAEDLKVTSFNLTLSFLF